MKKKSASRLFVDLKSAVSTWLIIGTLLPRLSQYHKASKSGVILSSVILFRK